MKIIITLDKKHVMMLDRLEKAARGAAPWGKRGHRADVVRWLLEAAERSGLTAEDFRRNDYVIVPPNH